MTEVIEMDSTLESVNNLEGVLTSYLNGKCTNDALFGDIMVAIMEAVNNAIRHGNKYDCEKKVILRMNYDHDVLEFRVSDEGKGFCLDQYTHNPTSIECRDKCHGRGLFLMKNLSDKIGYLDQGRTVVLNFVVKD